MNGLRLTGLILICGMLSSCAGLPFSVSRGRGEVFREEGWMMPSGGLLLQPGSLVLEADLSEEMLRSQASRALELLCLRYGGGDRVMRADVVLTERSYLRKLKLRRSVGLEIVLRDTNGDAPLRVLILEDGPMSLESASYLYGLLDRGFRRLLR